MAKDSLVKASHIDWSFRVPAGYGTKDYDPFNLNIMKTRNESHCNLSGACDKQFDNTYVKEGKIKDIHLQLYIHENDSQDIKTEKGQPHKFRISKGVKFNNPNYPNNQNEELLDEVHWVVAPCPPFCDLYDDENQD